jgi:hypothetical protein
MIQSPSLISARNQAIKEFHAIQTRAVLNSWMAKLLMKHNGLRSLVGSNVTGLHGKRMARVQRIRTDKIVGTIRYSEEFDKDFRPLKHQLCDRWVQIFLQLDEDRWKPIVVHKVGESYYVANGHYQVSVARYVGMKFIEAEVWDHSACRASHGSCSSMQRMPRQRKESFSTN